MGHSRGREAHKKRKKRIRRASLLVKAAKRHRRSFPMKTMYRVEKFTPTHCPNCNRHFFQINEDWTIYFGTIVDGRKTPDPEWPRIRCQGCKQLVKITMQEEYNLASKAQAERLIAEKGFVNLLVCQACGNMAQDHHVVHTAPSKLEVIDCTKPRK